MVRRSTLMSKVMVFLLAFAVVFTYSVVPMNMAFAASAKKPAKVKITSAKATSSSAVKVKWKKAKNAKKYEIWYSTKSKKGFKKGATVKGAKKTSGTVKKLKAGKKYYFKVRAVNGKKKGKFSKTKSATTKKAPAPTPTPTPTPAPEPSNVKETPQTLGETKTRTMVTEIDVSKYDEGKVVKVWVPVPQSDEFQTISNVSFDKGTAEKAEITTETGSGYNNKMLYLEWGKDHKGARTASLTFTAERYQVGRAKDSIKEDPSATIPADVKPYITKESDFVKINDPVVKKYAAEAAGDAKGTVEKARAIYEWEFNHLERIDNGETLKNAKGEEKTFSVDGCGYGDTVRILTDYDTFGRAGGHCTDLNSTFVALCRANGIPARELFGIRMNDDASGGQHCWAEFYVAGTGWVYADPGDALKAIKSGKGMTADEVEAARKAYDMDTFWGKVDNNRIVLSRGRDITFNPPQAWGVCNTFGYPAAEVDGKRLDTFTDPKAFDYSIKSLQVKETPQTLGEAKTRTMVTNIDVSKYDEGKVVKVWVPVPQSDEFQTISNVSFDKGTAEKAEITTETGSGYNNQMLYLEWGKNYKGARTASLTFTAKRYQVGREKDSIKEDPNAVIPPGVKPYITKESDFVKINDPVVKKYAAEAAGDAKGTVEKARAIYEWEFNHLERIDNGETLKNAKGEEKTFTVDGCGYGDTVRILTDYDTFGRAGGHCTDLNSTFVALCRANGIPARELFGIRMNDDASGGQHCWAEFYVAGTGWVYADPGDALKAIKSGKGMTADEVEAARKAYDMDTFWGKVDNNRIVLSRGRDITFNPPQAWGVCNTFGYPAAEVDGKRLDTFTNPKDFDYTIKSVEDKTVFVDAAYVKEASDRMAPDTVIAEVSWGATEEDGIPKEYVPGAIHVNTDDLESNMQDLDYELWDLRGADNNFKQLADALASYGITKDTSLICYGWDGANSAPTRLAFAALMMGVKDVKVLDGGAEAWTKAGYPDAPKSEPKAADSFGLDAPAHPEWVLSTEDLVAGVESDSLVPVSIRSYDEFIGAESGYPYIDKAGEPKGAVWGRDTDDDTDDGVTNSPYFIDGKTVGVDKVIEYISDYDATENDMLAFYCGTGWRATIPFLICYQAGMSNIRLWDDGWYVYSGAFYDDWNCKWVDGAAVKPAKEPVDTYPVQLGDPKFGTATYTTVGELKADHNPLRKLEAKAASVNAAPGKALDNGFTVMPPKANINDSLVYSSDNEAVATIDAEGKVTVKDDAAIGSKATITATTNATFGADPKHADAGKPKTASYEVVVAKTTSYEEMNAEEWKACGINYEDIDLSKDFILDVRTPENFAKGHLVGATNVSVADGPIDESTEAGQAVAKGLEDAYTAAAGKRIVVVCNSGQSLAKRAMEYFRTHDKEMNNVTYLIGGNKGVAEGEYKLNNGITLDQVAADDFIIDVRPAAQKEANGTIPGAVEVEDSTDAASLKAAYDNAGGKRIVLVCVRGISLARNAMIALKSSGADMKTVTYLIGGFNESWKLGKEYAIGDVAVDPVKKTVSTKATVNGAFLTPEADESLPFIYHFIRSADASDALKAEAALISSGKATDIHAALKAVGAVAWSDEPLSIPEGKVHTDVAEGNADVSHLTVTVDGAPVSDVLKYKDAGADADSAAALDLIYAGNLENNKKWSTGCVICLQSCPAGIVTNNAVPSGTASKDKNYLYLDNTKLTADQEVEVVFALS